MSSLVARKEEFVTNKREHLSVHFGGVANSKTAV
jgi:hypothetical protein